MARRTRSNPRVANDNGSSAGVVSLSAYRENDARRPALMRDWAPAILATFFTVGHGTNAGARSVATGTRGRPNAKP
jgi:hypothetical protein